MNRLLITVHNITAVMTAYNQIRLYRSSESTGPFNEITTEETRIQLLSGRQQYYFEDINGTSDHWYQATYYDLGTGSESEPGEPFQVREETEKIGWTFGNYRPPPNEWGDLLTPDDMRETYLFGVEEVAQDTQESYWEDSQYRSMVEFAMADFERYLHIDIRKRVYKTNPPDDLTQEAKWRSGVDYTHEEDPYPFDPQTWEQYGFLRLRHRPVISVERAELFSMVQGQAVLDLAANNWVRIQKKVGTLNFFPRDGAMYGPFGAGYASYFWRILHTRYPQGLEIDYTTGWKTAEFVPHDLRDVIGKYAAIKSLSMIGDGLLAGFSSSSVSLDGISESFSSTQSATSAYFGARIKQYQDEIAEWLKNNRRKFDIPVSFVGV